MSYRIAAAAVLLTCASLLGLAGNAAQPATHAQSAGDRPNVAALLGGGRLRAVNRDVTKLDGDRAGVHLSEAEGPGVLWVEGTEFDTGTIALDVRGRDLVQRSFVGVAFHRKDDNTYEAVYLRPFNFRTDDAARRQHAVQYIAAPDYDWARLRSEFPEEFEHPVDASIDPTAWVSLRVIVREQSVQVYVGDSKTAALDTRRLGQLPRGLIGFWVGNNSDGDFANLRITTQK